ncbi:MAG: NADH-quinone oxidoreductase subunit J [Polyangiales bacterium]
MSGIAIFFFWALSIVALLAAFGAIASQTPIRSALSLLTTILALAAIYISLYAHLLGAVQLIVYAGAVVVLFVFVIMLIGPTTEPSKPLATGLIAPVLSICVMAGVSLSIAAAVGSVSPELPTLEGCANGVPECGQFGGVRAIAGVLYKSAAVPFELVSILLLVAILGAIAVARGRTIGEAQKKKAAAAELAPSSAE